MNLSAPTFILTEQSSLSD